MKTVLRLLPLALLSGIICLLTACSDPEPGEVSMNTTLDGKPRSTTVQAFNAAGNQVQEVSSDQYGVAYVKALAPGNYTFKFKSHDGSYYPAERAATVVAGGSVFLRVDLNQAADPGAGG